MQCNDLERYLEGYLDGRLGRTRAALLRRHLNHCSLCQGRVRELKQFERDMQIRIHARQPAMSVWSGLDLDLVRSNAVFGREPSVAGRFLQSPPHPASLINGLGIASRLPIQMVHPREHVVGRRLIPKVMIALVALATAGSMALSGARMFKSPPAVGSPAYRMIVETDEPLPLQSSDPARLQQWLTAETGMAIPPLPVPQGFVLAGGRVEHADGQPHPVVVYRHAGQPALLTLTPIKPEAAEAKIDSPPTFAQADGFTRMTWRAHGFLHEVISQANPVDLRSFDLASPTPL